MADISFEWDERKNTENRTKHWVSFEEAQSVFLDENAVQFLDEAHSSPEDRFLMLGMSSRFRLLLAAYTFRGDDSVIRIISARKATKREGRQYPRRKP